MCSALEWDRISVLVCPCLSLFLFLSLFPRPFPPSLFFSMQYEQIIEFTSVNSQETCSFLNSLNRVWICCVKYRIKLN